MPTLVTLLLLLSSTNAFQITTCDCNKPSRVGLLQFSDGSCEPATCTPNTKSDYRVMTDKKAAFNFPGYICDRWKSIKDITIDFVGQVITVPERIAMETTAVECDIVRQSRRCNESSMMKSENTWIFNQEPEDKGYWLRTATVVTVNCMLEEVVLSRYDEGDMINTPLGKSNRKAWDSDTNIQRMGLGSSKTTQNSLTFMAVDYAVVIRNGNSKIPKNYLPSEMAQPRTRDGSTISMPDIDSRSQTSRTPEERIQAIEAARVERDTLVAILEEHCRGIEQLVNNRGRRSILKHLKTQIHSRLEQVRNAHFLYNQRLWEANKPMTDAYTYIIGIEIHVREQSGRGGPSIPLMPSFSSDDWINRRTPPPRGASAGFSPNWLMNALPQIKITPFNGDPKESPTFISSFRDMIHNVVPSDAERHAFLKQLLNTEVGSYIAEYLDNPSTYYDALVKLKAIRSTTSGCSEPFDGSYESSVDPR
ncbi:Uncharacterized protein APZ42_030181 [Daphnia magna]|uniref:Uncharacterized protein n=1 Tax=Daphnia magna TaxID=35525 RepID=A0A162D3G4_9CRUS|nr:Uncharacterized protein APZ42_030181 [Daphnia magna]